MASDRSPEDELPPSRSQLRREALDVFELGEHLCTLTPSQLAKVPLPDAVLDALTVAQSITSHIARKRQLQFLAKQLRRVEDLGPIRDAAFQPLEVRRRETALMHRIERWRDRLIDEGDPALDALLAEHPQGDRQRMRQLIRQARIEREKQKPPKAQREIYQEVKALLAGNSRGEPDEIAPV